MSSTMPIFSLCLSHRRFSPLTSAEKNTSHTELGPDHVTPLHINYLFKGFISKHSHILRSWELEPPYTNLGRGTVQSLNNR